MNVWKDFTLRHSDLHNGGLNIHISCRRLPHKGTFGKHRGLAMYLRPTLTHINGWYYMQVGKRGQCEQEDGNPPPGVTHHNWGNVTTVQTLYTFLRMLTDLKLKERKSCNNNEGPNKVWKF